MQEAINAQVNINNFLKTCGIKDLVGDYGELIVENTIGGKRQNAVNQGFDIMHDKYNRIEVKTRKYKRNASNKLVKENRAVGFTGKKDNFDWLAHIILDEEYRVIAACLAKYDEVWPIIQSSSGKISYSQSLNSRDSKNITEEAQAIQRTLNNQNFI